MENSRLQLERRLAELSAEIHRYPGPIARCDEQLTGLLEERSRVLRILQENQTCTPAAVWTNDGGFNAA